MKRLLLLTFLLLTVTFAKSQTISGAPKACPTSVFNYALTTPESGKIYRWKVSKGKRTSDNSTEFCALSATIRWDSDLAQNGKIEVYSVTACNQSTPGTLVTSFDVKAFNFVAGSALPNANGTCDATPTYPSLTCGTSQDIDVWFMLPLYGNSDYNDDSSYDFNANANQVSVPEGWSVIASSFSTSTYSCHAGLPFKKIMVRVRTDGVHQGDVKIRVSGNCNGATTPFYGAWSNARNFSFEAPNLEITGPPSFCTTATYTIPNLPAGSTVTWSVGALGTIVGSNTGNSVEISSTEMGNITLSATVSTGCGSYPVSKTIFVGLPWITSIAFKNGSRNYFCANARGNTFTISLSDGQNPSDYTYDIELVDANTDVVVASFISGYTGTVSPHYNPSILYIFKARIRNHPCVITGWSGQMFEFTDCVSGGTPTRSFVVYPNPSSTELKVAYKTDSEVSNTSKSSDKSSLSIKLLNKKGEVLKERNAKASDKEIVLQVADIPNGIYYLHIYEGKKVTKQQVVIAH